MFSLPFIKTTLDIDNDDLLKSINDFDAEWTWPLTSKVKTSFGGEWVHQPFLDAIFPHVQNYISKYIHYVGPINCQLWFNLYEETFFQEEHTHSEMDALISGVYYAKMPDRSTPTVFSSNYKDLLRFCGYKNELGEFSPKVDQGDLILFPPFVKHYVPQQSINEQRITVAFNIMRGNIQ